MEKEGKMEEFDNMEYLCLDICQLEKEDRIEPDSYDLVIDKACLDCVMCSADPDRPAQAIRNIHSWLTSGGTYLLISRAPPQARMYLFLNEKGDALDSDMWKSIEVAEITKSMELTAYQ